MDVAICHAGYIKIKPHKTGALVSILNNAIDSIAVGLEDYDSPDERRIISCTRNLFAGILLLFKHKLVLLSEPDSDEALIKQRVLPVIEHGEKLSWKGRGSKTVDVQGIKERFESLNVEVDWKRFDKINSFRNEIEHYFSRLKHEAIRSLISDSFLIIDDFVRKHLGEDPRELLGANAWNVLLGVNEIYKREKAECDAALGSLTYFDEEIHAALEGYSCNECGSRLITPTDTNEEAYRVDYICKSCNHNLTYEQIVEAALNEFYGPEIYLSHTDGGDTPLADCPSCGGPYLYSLGVCATCGLNARRTCSRCSSTIIPSEFSSSPLCGYCECIMNKDE